MPQKCQDVGFFDNFFISKKSSENFSDHLGRSEISPGIQKSYLENHAMSVEMRKIDMYQNDTFRLQIIQLSTPTGTEIGEITLEAYRVLFAPYRRTKEGAA